MNNLPPGYTQAELDGEYNRPYKEYKRRKRLMSDNAPARANGMTDKEYWEYQDKKKAERQKRNDEALELLNNMYESAKDEEDYGL